MIVLFKNSLRSQFGAAIDTLINAVKLCTDDYWQTQKRFFYTAYHTAVFLDYYLTFPAARMSCPLPFTFTAAGKRPPEALDDIIPDRHYSREEVLNYLQSCRSKCFQLINGLTEESFSAKWQEVDDDRSFPLPELLLYNMRHVQHHAAQLNSMLSHDLQQAPQWIGRVRE